MYDVNTELHEQRTCNSNGTVCNVVKVTQSQQKETDTIPNYENRQQYLNVINQHTNNQINTLIEDFNNKAYIEGSTTPVFRLTMYDRREEILYELCKFHLLLNS